MKTMISILIFAASLAAQTTINGGRTITGAWDASGATSTKPLKVGTALPEHCSVGEMFLKSDATPGQNIFLCTSTDTWTPATRPSLRTIGFTVDGHGSTITTGQKAFLQVQFACTIVGWSLRGKEESGSAVVEVSRHSSNAPPDPPAVPNTTTDKITASAPLAMSSAQTAAGAASSVSTWSKSISPWDAIAFNVVSAAGITQLHAQVYCQQ